MKPLKFGQTVRETDDLVGFGAAIDYVTLQDCQAKAVNLYINTWRLNENATKEITTTELGYPKD